jgi:phosphoglucomutase
LLSRLREQPPESMGGLKTARTRDYLSCTLTPFGGRPQPLDAPAGDMLIFDLLPDGNYVAVRPSGTEPKVKFYMFAFDPPDVCGDLPVVKAAQSKRLAAVEQELRKLIA